MAKGLFITGTGTDVGKTFVTGLILKALHQGGYQAAYYKAAMSGNQRGADGALIPGDALFVKSVSGIDQPLEEMCPYVYENAVSPHLAAQMEGNPVEMEKALAGFDQLAQRYQLITVEGSGGILCPLRFDQQKIQLTDFIKAKNLSCLIVADAGLGTINSVGLTVAYMKGAGIPIKGLIFNRFQPGNPMHEDNVKMCACLTGLKVIAQVQEGASQLEISPTQLAELYEEVNGGGL